MSDNANDPMNDNKTPKQVADELGVPLIPPVSDKPWKPEDIEPNPVVAVCGQCGLKIHKTMGYNCPHPKCPLSPRIIS